MSTKLEACVNKIISHDKEKKISLAGTYNFFEVLKAMKGQREVEEVLDAITATLDPCFMPDDISDKLFDDIVNGVEFFQKRMEITHECLNNDDFLGVDKDGNIIASSNKGKIVVGKYENKDQ